MASGAEAAPAPPAAAEALRLAVAELESMYYQVGRCARVGHSSPLRTRRVHACAQPVPRVSPPRSGEEARAARPGLLNACLCAGLASGLAAAAGVGHVCD